MTVSTIGAKSILRKHKRIDSWFISRYSMNLYRGCLHNCVYCDGRTERYNVEGEFGKDVGIKENAIEILRRELDPKRKRVPFKRGYILLGGGVGDSYQQLEKKCLLSRRALELILEFGFPVHVLTKSTLVERDVDLLKQINEKNRVIVSMSFSSMDEEISAIFEPGVPSPAKRLETLKKIKSQGIACGMFLMPVIPFITDTPRMIEKSFRDARLAGLDFVIFSGMTLKGGRQKDHFYNTLRDRFPNLVEQYHRIYASSKWGETSTEYCQYLQQVLNQFANKFNIPIRVPSVLFKDILDDNDKVVVILDQLDYLLKQQGSKSPYGYAAYSISNIKEPLANVRENLSKLSGIGPATELIIKEILDTGSSAYYEKLMG